MKYEDIKFFSERCEEHPDHQSGMISNSMIQQRLHEEIDELRAYIESQLAQPEQEPVAWVYPEGLEALKAGKPWTAYGTRQEPDNTALYLSPHY